MKQEGSAGSSSERGAIPKEKSPPPTQTRDNALDVQPESNGLGSNDHMKAEEEDRKGEFGVIGAEQSDESFYDTRHRSRTQKTEEACHIIVNTENTEKAQDQVHNAGSFEDSGGRIEFLDERLYGRDDEVLQLHELWQSHCRHNLDMQNNKETTPTCEVMISGYSGSGKSRLVETFVSEVQQQQTNGKEKAIYLRAKYSQLSLGTGPLGSFGSLFDNIYPQSREPLQECLKNILPTVLPAEMSDINEPKEIDSHQYLGEDEAHILVRIFPGLQGAMRNDHGEASAAQDDVSVASFRSVSTRASKYLRSRGTKMIENKTVLLFVLQKFFGLLCSNPECPVFLMLDDLQWADEQSLQLIEALLSASDGKRPMHLFLIGSYRSNEVDDKHKVTAMLKSIEEVNKKPVPVITLPELSLPSITQMIADSLQMADSQQQVEPLAQAIYAKTLGNPLFTRQALEQLASKNAIYWDNISFSWAWNLRQQELQDLITDDIVEMVQSKISRLDPEIQHILKVTACTRSTVDIDTLLELIHPELAGVHTEETQKQQEAVVAREHYAAKKAILVEHLDKCVSEGLLVQSSTSSSSETYSFAHDRIEEASRRFVYDKMKQDERSSFLESIGKSLYRRADSDQGEDWMYFAAAKHLNEYGTTPVGSGDRGKTSVELAMLNNHTAKLSMELLAFETAAEYASRGIECLIALQDSDKVMWMDHLELTVSLHTVGAEAEYGQGNPDRASAYCKEVLKHHEEHRYDIFLVLGSIQVLVDILSGRGEKQEAFELAHQAVADLGFFFPSSPPSLVCKKYGKETKTDKTGRYLRMVAAMRLRQAKAKYIPTEASINDLPYISDPMLVETFDMLHKMGSMAHYLHNVPLYVMIYCDALKWINRNGMTDASASAIASFANALMHVYGDFEVGARLAELAILVTRRIKKKFYETRALNTAGAFVLSWVRPLRTCLKYHSQAIESGTMSGNIEGVAVAKVKSCWNMLYSAAPLGQLESFCRVGLPPLRKMELHFDANVITTSWQTVLNLMGRSENTVRLIGEAMDENVAPYADGPFKSTGDIWRRFLCLFFGEWEEGAENALAAGDSFTKMFKGLMFGMETVIRGLLLVCMARKDKSTKLKYKKGAQPVLKQLHIWVSKGCVNLVGPTKLMDAEMAVIDGKKGCARPLFEESISIAEKGEFHQFAGLSYERFAMYLREDGDLNAAKENLAKSIQAYQRWGAQKKVEQLQSALSSLMA